MSVVVCVGIEFVPGDHGDSGDGLAWLGVMVLLDVVPFGLVLALCGLMLLLLDDRKRGDRHAWGSRGVARSPRVSVCCAGRTLLLILILEIPAGWRTL